MFNTKITQVNGWFTVKGTHTTMILQLMAALANQIGADAYETHSSTEFIEESDGPLFVCFVPGFATAV